MNGELNHLVAEGLASGLLRDPDLVMAPGRLGAARLTRYSFSRTMLRRAQRNGWTVARAHLDLDIDGQGEVAYRIEAEGHVFHFVAFLQALSEDEHTDRVIAERWEIAAALVEGELDDAQWQHLRANVPEQERGRLGPDVLTLTRGNRSLRFFDYLVTELAAGRQPDPERVGDAGYIMRSTAFYANGKFGMRSFGGYAPDHPLAAPYRAQFLAGWCYRELSYDTVEHCARLRGGEAAVGFEDGWRTFFGLGNATGLGLVPYGFKHPRIINSWVAIRELSLARVRSLDGTTELVDRFRGWLQRAEEHYRTGTSEDATPFFSPAQLIHVVADITEAFEQVAEEPRPFDALAEWAATQHVECSEMVVSLLIELDGLGSDGTPDPARMVELDDQCDRLLRVTETAELELAMTVVEALELLESRFAWVLETDLGDDRNRTKWWVYSTNTEEPRRIDRSALGVSDHDMGIDIAYRMQALARDLRTWPSDAHLGEVAATRPDHLLAIERLFVSDQPYGEPRDNPCCDDYLPLQIQRFQLAQYGMDNFKPKSTDWLRVTLFQGAPRHGDLVGGYTDDWVLPPLPSPPAGSTGQTASQQQHDAAGQ